MAGPFGTILIAIRDDTAVGALTGGPGNAGRVSANPRTPPSIRLRQMPTSPNPFGTQVGVMRWRAVAQCYGRPNNENGPEESWNIAAAVVAALNGKMIPAVPGSRPLVIRVFTPEIGEMLLDPDTKAPYHPVRIEAYAASQ